MIEYHFSPKTRPPPPTFLQKKVSTSSFSPPSLNHIKAQENDLGISEGGRRTLSGAEETLEGEELDPLTTLSPLFQDARIHFNLGK